jgi:hypothetical protein
MKNITTIILVAVIALLIGYIILQPTPQPVDKYAKEKATIDSLNNVVANLIKQQATQDSVIDTYKHKIDSLYVKIAITEKELAKSRKDHGTKIQAASNYTPSEIDNFFSNRYSH